jgi:hypothetical protein
VDVEKASDDVQAHAMILEDKGSQDRPCAPVPELGQLRWRDFPMAQRVL